MTEFLLKTTGDLCCQLLISGFLKKKKKKNKLKELLLKMAKEE